MRSARKQPPGLPPLIHETRGKRDEVLGCEDKASWAENGDGDDKRGTAKMRERKENRERAERSYPVAGTALDSPVRRAASELARTAQNCLATCAGSMNKRHR